MKKVEKIKLSPYEAAAYWWINAIRGKISELSKGYYVEGYNEKRFFEIFSEYTDENWRKVFTYLAKDIEEKSKSADADGIIYTQATTKRKHVDINKALEIIADSSIADVDIANKDGKTSIISTSGNKTLVASAEDGCVVLPSEYDPTFIIDGDKEKYDFYRLLVATLFSLDHKESDVEQTEMLREGFCEKYIEDNAMTEEEYDTVEENFNYYFDLANSRGLVLGKSSDEYFKPTIKQSDLVGLDDFFGKALNITNRIEIPRITDKPKGKRKKRKNE